MADIKSAEKRGERGKYQKGTKPGPGRPKGKLNKLTQAVKDIFDNSLATVIKENPRYFVELAESRPDVFCSIVKERLPKRVEVTGADGERLYPDLDLAAKNMVPYAIKEED